MCSWSTLSMFCKEGLCRVYSLSGFAHLSQKWVVEILELFCLNKTFYCPSFFWCSEKLVMVYRGTGTRGAMDLLGVAEKLFEFCIHLNKKHYLILILKNVFVFIWKDLHWFVFVFDTDFHIWTQPWPVVSTYLLPHLIHQKVIIFCWCMSFCGWME